MSTKLGDGHFIGALRATRHVEGLTLAETAYKPQSCVPVHEHDSALLALVLTGAMTEQRGRAQKMLEQGGLLFHPAHEPHEHHFHDGGARLFVLQFGGAWITRMRSLGVEEPSAPLGLHGSRANWLAHTLYREFCEADAASALAIEGFALALLGELARTRMSRKGGARPRWLVRAEEMLRSHGPDNLSMSAIADAVGVHPTHLARTFRQYHGLSMGEYLRRLRVEHARRELTEGTKPLASIAAESGFVDQPHLSRVFKQITGYTPRQYRAAFGLHSRAAEEMSAPTLSGDRQRE